MRLWALAVLQNEWAEKARKENTPAGEAVLE